MFSKERKLGVLLVLLCVMAAQVHLFADMDPCLVKGGSSHSNAGHNHRCQGCESGNVVIFGALPSVSPFLRATRLDSDALLTFVSRPRAEDHAPRAPPR